MHRDAGEWRQGEGISPSALSKEGQRWRRCLFIIGVRAIANFLSAKDFALSTPNLPEKFLCNFCLQIFSHKDHQDLC